MVASRGAYCPECGAAVDLGGDGYTVALESRDSVLESLDAHARPPGMTIDDTIREACLCATRNRKRGVRDGT